MSRLSVNDPVRASDYRPRVLLVDDDSATLRLLAAALSSTPFEIQTATSGEEALAIINSDSPELVILDYEMPGKNGAEVCAMIRKSGTDDVQNLPIIMLTAHTGESEEVGCLKAGANDFVSKPVSAAVLQARIVTQLRLRSHARELEHWRKRYEADLACARLTQQGLIPQSLPDLGEWEMEAVYTPFIEVGGDVYGWEKLHDGRWVIWMADGIGHGAAAALMTALTVHLFTKACEMAVSPSEVLARVNEEFIRAVAAKTFLTACCAILDHDGSIIFSAAGHPSMLVRRSNGDVESFASDKGMLGVTAGFRPTENAVSLGAGEVFLVYTDGIHCIRSRSGREVRGRYRGESAERRSTRTGDDPRFDVTD